MKNICVFCGAKVEPKITRVVEEIGNEIMIIDNVPADRGGWFDNL